MSKSRPLMNTSSTNSSDDPRSTTNDPRVPRRSLPVAGFSLPTLGFGAFKIGRNQGVKYPTGYDLPSDADTDRLLNGVLDLGVSYIDTAPAYGLSEERIGRFLGKRSAEFRVSTKVGETFENGVSTYDFSERAVRASLERSRNRLRRDVLDMVFVHSDGRDGRILRETDVVPTLRAARDEGIVRAIGFSGKTVVGAFSSLTWADALMVEYHLEDRSHLGVIEHAASLGVGVIVKKGLASGHLSPQASIDFVLTNPNVTSLVIGGLNLDHLRDNITVAAKCAPWTARERVA